MSTRRPRAPTAVIEQMVADLTELDEHAERYMATVQLFNEEEWRVIQHARQILADMLARKASKIATSLNTDWAWDVRTEQDMPDAR